MRVRFETREWERSNGGRSPRGRGQWMFRNQAEWNMETNVVFRSEFTTFTEARNAARAWAEGNGFETVWVCA